MPFFFFVWFSNNDFVFFTLVFTWRVESTVQFSMSWRQECQFVSPFGASSSWLRSFEEHCAQRSVGWNVWVVSSLVSTMLRCVGQMLWIMWKRKRIVVKNLVGDQMQQKLLKSFFLKKKKKKKKKKQWQSFGSMRWNHLCQNTISRCVRFMCEFTQIDR